jgi:hypothetical protein
VSFTSHEPGYGNVVCLQADHFFGAADNSDDVLFKDGLEGHVACSNIFGAASGVGTSNKRDAE